VGLGKNKNEEGRGGGAKVGTVVTCGRDFWRCEVEVYSQFWLACIRVFILNTKLLHSRETWESPTRVSVSVHECMCMYVYLCVCAGVCVFLCV